jgi:hypothetical protein
MGENKKIVVGSAVQALNNRGVKSFKPLDLSTVVLFLTFYF